MKHTFWQAIWAYVKKQVSIIIMLSITFFIFGFVFTLYHITLEPIWYAFTLIIFTLLIIGGIRFLVFYKKYNFLMEMKNRVSLSIENLPQATDAIEEEYQELLKILNENCKEAISKTDQARTDMINYYTLWAHQIKTPIAAIKLLLQSKVEGEQIVSEKEELGEQIFKVEQYVEMVLQYLRMADMSSDLLIQVYNLDDIVKQVVKKYAKIFIRRKISLIYEPLNCQVLSDEKWLVFVIEQIVSNALKYTKQGKICIYMDTSEEQVLVIEDTGIGIKPEDLPRVFEKGFTGFNGREDKKSTGIGLFLCHQIMTKLSHSIEIKSQIGVGTKVKLYLFHEKDIM